jgi:hypothetical protein
LRIQGNRSSIIDTLFVFSEVSCSLVSQVFGPKQGGSAVEEPIFGQASQSFSQYLRVSLSCATEGASIYYSLDGSTPTAQSTRYSEPLFLFSTATVRAYAAKNGLNDSAENSQTFTRSSEPSSRDLNAGITCSSPAYTPGTTARFFVNIAEGLASNSCDLSLLIQAPDGSQSWLGGGSAQARTTES